MKAIATTEGHKSQDAKKNIIMKLLAAAKDAEPGFLVRSIQGKLRIGLAEQSVLIALAQATTLEVWLQLGYIIHVFLCPFLQESVLHLLVGFVVTIILSPV